MLDEQSINSIKFSKKSKLIFLDGYDEYSGEYFRIYDQLNLNQWANTFIIVTSRKEKMSESDACSYFSINHENGKRDENSFTIVKLEEFKRKDVDKYCEMFFKK